MFVLVYFMYLYIPLSKPAVCVPENRDPELCSAAPSRQPGSMGGKASLSSAAALPRQPVFLAAPGRPLTAVPPPPRVLPSSVSLLQERLLARPLPAASVSHFCTRSETNSFSSAATAR